MELNLTKSFKNYVYVDGGLLTPPWLNNKNAFTGKDVFYVYSETYTSPLTIYIGFSNQLKAHSVELTTDYSGDFSLYYTDNDWVIASDDSYTDIWTTSNSLTELIPNTLNEFAEISFKCIKLVFNSGANIEINDLKIYGDYELKLSTDYMNVFMFDKYKNNMSKIFDDSSIKEIVDNYISILNPDVDEI